MLFKNGKQHPHWEAEGPGTNNAWVLTVLCSPQTQNVQLNKEMTLASNRSLAEGNLLYQPQLDARKACLTQKYQELQVLFEAYQMKKTQLGNPGPSDRPGTELGALSQLLRPGEQCSSGETWEEEGDLGSV